MDKLEIIEQRVLLGKQFTIYGTIDNPLFLAKEIANWIDYDTDKVGQMIGNVDTDEKKISPIFYSGQVREMWLLTEDGLYEVLMQSHKPIAKQIKKQIKEILRTIRKHGAYLTPQKIEEVLLNPDTIIQLATSLKDEREKRKELELQNAQKEQIIHELQPKATYYDLILQSKTVLSISKIAKDYGKTANEMNKLLHDLGVQYKEGGVWLLYKKYAPCGYTQSKTHIVDDAKSVFHTYWTQKGRLFIYDLLKNERNVLPLIERREGAAQ